MGFLSKDLEDELWIWRPIMAGKCSLEAVIGGAVTIDHLMRLNALLDMSEAYAKFNEEEAERKRKK